MLPPRLVVSTLFCLLLILPPSCRAFAAVEAASAPVPPACRIPDPLDAAASEPPAWLLLAGAVALLAAGRLAERR